MFRVVALSLLTAALVILHAPTASAVVVDTNVASDGEPVAEATISFETTGGEQIEVTEVEQPAEMPATTTPQTPSQPAATTTTTTTTAPPKKKTKTVTTDDNGNVSVEFPDELDGRSIVAIIRVDGKVVSRETFIVRAGSMPFNVVKLPTPVIPAPRTTTGQPPTTRTGTPTRTEGPDAFMLRFGHFSRSVPTVAVGTLILGPGVEIPVAVSPDRMSGLGYSADVSGVGPGNWRISIGWGPMIGSSYGEVQPGGSTGIIYLFQRMGTTGVGPLVSGVRTTIESQFDWFDFTAMRRVTTFGTSDPASDGMHAKLAVGPDFTYRATNHGTHQQDLTFADLYQDTSIKFDDYFFGVRGALSAYSVSGPFHYGAEIYGAVGLQYFSLNIDQHNVCGGCAAAFQDFFQSIDASQTRLAVKGGATIWAGYKVGQNSKVGARAGVDFEPLSGYVVAYSPTQQPGEIVNDWSVRWRFELFWRAELDSILTY